MTHAHLPAGYREAGVIDLLRDRRKAILVNALALATALVMAAAGVWLFPPPMRTGGVGPLLVLLAALVVLMVVHELIHGIFMRRYSGQKPEYGFTGLYAFCACPTVCFDKRDSLVILWSPVVFIGVALLVLQFVLPLSWCWGVYLLQIVNLSGAAGDFYVSRWIRGLPADILIRDTGVQMTCFARVTETGQ